MEIKLNIIDRAIMFLNPDAGLKRMQNRAFGDHLKEQFRMYDAAGKGRRTKGWRATGISANKETEIGLYTLRNRSRELVRNNPYAKRAIQGISTNTIGVGITAKPIEREGVRFNKKTSQAWTDWAGSNACDYDDQVDFYGLQRLAMRCIAESGEVLIRRRWVEGKAIPIQLQVLEPDLLDHFKNTPVTNTGSYCVQGVQFNKEGKREGYWLYPCHPGEGIAIKSELIPAKEVLHVYYKERAGQVRGVPFGSSAAISLYDFDEYEQAQLVRQKIASCFAIFVQDNDADITRPSNTNTKMNREKVEPGIIEHLPQGKTVTMANPPGVQGYDEYTRVMLRKVAVGYGVSYEMLTGDLSNVNFSSGRMGWLEFHRLISEWQNLMLIPMLCDPVFDWFIEAAALMGLAQMGTKATWTPPKREMIDPAKEGKAMGELVRNGFQSWSGTVRQLGFDPMTILKEITEDFTNFDKNKLMLMCDPRYDATRTNGAIPDPNADKGGGTGSGGTGTKTNTKTKKKKA